RRVPVQARAQGGLHVPHRPRRAAARAALGALLPRQRGPLLRLRPRAAGNDRQRLHRLALLRPPNPKPEETAWGSISLMDAEKRLLANALLDFSNERFVLLSESCIPLHSFRAVYDYLIGSRHSFVEVYFQQTKQCQGRYSRRMAPAIRLPQWRKGSQWFELSRDLAIDVLADTKYYPLFRRHCRPSCYPDEHYLPTTVNMLHGARNANRTVTYVDWSKGGAHPAKYTAGNVTAAAIQGIRRRGWRNDRPCYYNQRPTSMCFLFARKFAPDTLGPLLNMSSAVMGY
uniref:Uncharacterized protein n=1 Tax=Aegilops tauschii subsp. strangulata TaxID=200361 RepID=A0A453G255_AEGTS